MNNNKIIATKVFSAEDWLKWLKDFADLVADRQFKKLDYQLWKNISKPVTSIITVTLISDTYIPTINIFNDLSVTTVTNIDNSLGEFLFNNIFNKEAKKRWI